MTGSKKGFHNIAINIVSTYAKSI